jgi:hypothetical protein
MPKRSSNSPAGKSVVAILMLTVLGACVLAAYVKLTPQAAHVTADRQADPDVSITRRHDHETKPSSQPQDSGLLVPGVVQNDVKLGKPAGQTPDGVAPEVFLVNQTLTSLQVDGARALGVEVKDHLAVVSFNPGIEKGYGTIEEGYLIKALSMALGQFKDIEKFQIAVDGKIVESLGNIDLTTPVNVIRPGDAPPPDDKS